MQIAKLTAKEVRSLAVFLIFLYLLLITPVRFGAAAAWHGGVRAEGAAAVLIWGVRVQAGFRVFRDETGKLRLFSDFRGRRHAAGDPLPNALTLLKTLKRANISSTLLKKGVRLRALSAEAEVGGMDAAAVALCTGLLRALDALLPGVRIQARPVFQGSGGLRARCIAEARLGTLMAIGALGLLSLRRQKEEATWNIPSET